MCASDILGSQILDSDARMVSCGRPECGVTYPYRTMHDSVLLVALASSVCGVFFFFQAEDGIRDYKVTGVQTCALPILMSDGLHSWQLPAAERRAALAQAGYVVRAGGHAVLTEYLQPRAFAEFVSEVRGGPFQAVVQVSHRVVVQGRAQLAVGRAAAREPAR